MPEGGNFRKKSFREPKKLPWKKPEANPRDPAPHAVRLADGGPILAHAQPERVGCSTLPFGIRPSEKTKGRSPLARPDAQSGSPRRFSVRQP